MWTWTYDQNAKSLQLSGFQGIQFSGSKVMWIDRGATRDLLVRCHTLHPQGLSFTTVYHPGHLILPPRDHLVLYHALPILPRLESSIPINLLPILTEHHSMQSSNLLFITLLQLNIIQRLDKMKLKEISNKILKVHVLEYKKIISLFLLRLK